MNRRTTPEQRLAAKLVRDLGRCNDPNPTEPRMLLILSELQPGDPIRAAAWHEALTAYRGDPKNKRARQRVQAIMEKTLGSKARLERASFLASTPDGPAIAASTGRPTSNRTDRPTKIGLGAYVVGTALCLGVYLFFADRHSGQVDFVMGAAFLIFSVLPGWLYLRFVHIKAAQVRADYVLALHRLGVDDPEYLPEPPKSSSYYDPWFDRGGSLNDGHGTIYMDKFNAVFGKRRQIDPRRERMACLVSLLPVGVVSVICAVGWGSILLDHAFLTDLSSPSAADVVRFGFLGAYAFVIQMLLRRFLQQDLKPGTYVSAAIRFLIVTILSFVVFAAWPGTPPRAVLAVAFVIGFFPIVGMQFLRGLASATLHRKVPSLQARYPLSQLDGLSVWYEAQLLEVGIEDMQNLLTANVVEIILNTRVPIGRLVDWIDQAALLVHLTPGTGEEESPQRSILRQAGIRCATDLEAVFQPGDQNDPCPSGDDLTAEESAELRTRMTSVFDETQPRPSTTLALLKAFRVEPNLILVRNWRHDWRSACHAESLVAEPQTGGGKHADAVDDVEDEAA